MNKKSLVECINTEGYEVPELKLKTPYTVRDIFKCDCGCGSTLLYLEEIALDYNPFTNVEYGFDIEDFRELQPPMDIKELIEESISQVA